MDVCEVLQRLHRKREVDSLKQPSHSTEKNNGSITRPSRTREVSSRHSYKSPTPPTPRRCASPNSTRTASVSAQPGPKRAVSVDRKRPSTPPSPSPPTTPVVELHSRRVTVGKLPESLWPSTMRSLNVTPQCDSISKKEKPVSHSIHDRTLKPSSNVASETRKATPERTPLKGKHTSDQSENSRPVDGVQARHLIDHHRWPNRAGGKLSSHSVASSDKTGKSSSVLLPSIGVSSLRRLSAEGLARPLHMHPSDVGGFGHPLIDEIGNNTLNTKDLDDTVLQVSTLHKLHLPKTSEIPSSVISAITSKSLPGSRLPSPSRASASRGMVSPSRTTPSTPTSLKGTNPSVIRPSSPTYQQMGSATSVFSYISDHKKGKKSINQSEDGHHLRLLYTRYLQWRFANAQADAALPIQKISAEETLINVWRATLELWNSVVMKRINLQKLKLELNLNMVLSDQLACLEEWSLLERDHSASLAGAINGLESSTLRLPITGGAMADIVSLEAAIGSSLAVMQAVIPSLHSALPKVEGMNYLASELANLEAEERAMLDECEAMLASIATMQEEEYGLRVQLIQLLQG